MKYTFHDHTDGEKNGADILKTLAEWFMRDYDGIDVMSADRGNGHDIQVTDSSGEDVTCQFVEVLTSIAFDEIKSLVIDDWEYPVEYDLDRLADWVLECKDVMDRLEADIQVYVDDANYQFGMSEADIYGAPSR